MKICAQLNENDIVFTVGTFGDAIVMTDKIIELESEDVSLLGKRYNRTTKTFEDVIIPTEDKE